MAVGGRKSLAYDVQFVEPFIQLGTNTVIQYIVHSNSMDLPAEKFSILLLQTTAEEGDDISTGNTIKLAKPQSGICIALEEDQCPTSNPSLSRIQLNNVTATAVRFTEGRDLDRRTMPKWVFFCFSSNDGSNDICRYYSSIFSIEHPFNDATIASNFVSPATTRSSSISSRMNQKRVPKMLSPGFSLEVVRDQSELIVVDNAPMTTLRPPTSTLIVPISTDTSIIKMSASSTGETPTSTVTATSAVTLAESSSKGGGLSIAAKAGIALGVLAFALILLILALPFLRRKHTRRNQPEQVVLSRSMHIDSFSQNLVIEKEDPTASSAAATPVDEPTDASLLPVQRQSAQEAYETVPSASSSGVAAVVPRRKPTTATLASTVSCGLSTTSGATSSGTKSSQSGGDEYEQYRDVVPIYGDARHVPQVFVGSSSAGGMQSPLLEEEEESMTPEEVARPEEEERRIDAAIAEAERR
ncbi:hypothetical protein WAI453_006994 [Rhynchosporium graminicola]|uniref:Uncharacterized protein n=1 Tax=Rhynchosporium graminicola TaxID=2792576 RepID=A0A1E1KTX7_9HELO|nr:uncharacterized protein RCO7_02138 [Rhynchosporium commune]